MLLHLKRFSELQQIVLTDPNISNVVASTKTLISLKHPIQSVVMAKTPNIATSSVSSADVNSYFSNVKNKADLAVALGKANVANADSVASQIDFQIQNVIAFGNHYPEVRKLSKDSIMLLFTSALNAQGVNTATAVNNINLKTFVADNTCYEAYNLTFNSCGFAFSISLEVIWATALITSFEAPIASDLIAIIGTAGAYLIWGDCVDTAGNMFDLCWSSSEQ